MARARSSKVSMMPGFVGPSSRVVVRGRAPSTPAAARSGVASRERPDGGPYRPQAATARVTRPRPRSGSAPVHGGVSSSRSSRSGSAASARSGDRRALRRRVRAPSHRASSAPRARVRARAACRRLAGKSAWKRAQLVRVRVEIDGCSATQCATTRPTASCASRNGTPLAHQGLGEVRGEQHRVVGGGAHRVAAHAQASRSRQPSPRASRAASTAASKSGSLSSCRSRL